MVRAGSRVTESLGLRAGGRRGECLVGCRQS